MQMAAFAGRRTTGGTDADRLQFNSFFRHSEFIEVVAEISDTVIIDVPAEEDQVVQIFDGFKERVQREQSLRHRRHIQSRQSGLQPDNRSEGK